jgi:CRP-like cAMP-binding protein
LGSVTAFETATIQSIARVAEIATEAEYAAGESIEAEGATANGVLVIASGQVEVTHASPLIVGRMGPGEIVGGPASLGIKKRLFAAKAIAPTVVLCIRYDDLFDIMEDHFDLTFSALFSLGNDLERTFTSPRPERAAPSRLPAAGEAFPTP